MINVLTADARIVSGDEAIPLHDRVADRDEAREAVSALERTRELTEFKQRHFEALAFMSPAETAALAMSAASREPEHPIFYARSLFAHWEAGGARVLNGTRALAYDTSKALQLAAIVRLGLRTLDAVEVLEGLQERDTVLRGGAVQAGVTLLLAALVNGLLVDRLIAPALLAPFTGN